MLFTDKIKPLLLCLMVGIGVAASSFTLSSSNLDELPVADSLKNEHKALTTSNNHALAPLKQENLTHVANTDTRNNTQVTHITHSSVAAVSISPSTTSPSVSTSPSITSHASDNLSSISLEQAQIDKVYVDKSEQRLYLMQGDTVIKSYHIALGDAPKGHKVQEGDERTPEGEYVLDYKNENSIAYRSIHVSYPNADDIARAKALGVSPGGAIMIHGQMNGAEAFTEVMQQRNWTDGCMAVTNEEMDEIMDAVKVGTAIEIEW